jgi:hypothetical protein
MIRTNPWCRVMLSLWFYIHRIYLYEVINCGAFRRDYII